MLFYTLFNPLFGEDFLVFLNALHFEIKVASLKQLLIYFDCIESYFPFAITRALTNYTKTFLPQQITQLC